MNQKRIPGAYFILPVCFTSVLLTVCFVVTIASGTRIKVHTTCGQDYVGPKANLTRGGKQLFEVNRFKHVDNYISPDGVQGMKSLRVYKRFDGYSPNWDIWNAVWQPIFDLSWGILSSTEVAVAPRLRNIGRESRRYAMTFGVWTQLSS